ncbi:MAG: hypothetical protein U9R48_05625 [Chloroflexota bacterium]|nr:hypothetical protein [Chloroflexota bacterium]
MLHRMIRATKRVPLCGALCLGIVWILFAGVALVGCQPTAEATLPPATAMAPSPPAPATRPVATPTASMATHGTAPATAAGEEPSVEAEPFRLTILHTNDTYGEVDPCG